MIDKGAKQSDICITVLIHANIICQIIIAIRKLFIGS